MRQENERRVVAREWVQGFSLALSSVAQGEKMRGKQLNIPRRKNQ
jgi:hypothetical protein